VPLGAPPAIVRVTRKNFLQDGVDDVIGSALDEPGIIFEKFVYGFF
jgi:hypothetical protein